MLEFCNLVNGDLLKLDDANLLTDIVEYITYQSKNLLLFYSLDMYVALCHDYEKTAFSTNSTLNFATIHTLPILYTSKL